jgi:hypothetical protein
MVALESITSALPAALRDQVLSYAGSVDSQIDMIVGGRTVARRQDLRDAIVLLAGLRKLRSIVAMASSMTKFAASELRDLGVESVSSGRMTIGGESTFQGDLRALESDLDRVLAEVQIGEFMNGTYGSVVETLVASGY